MNRNEVFRAFWIFFFLSFLAPGCSSGRWAHLSYNDPSAYGNFNQKRMIFLAPVSGETEWFSNLDSFLPDLFAEMRIDIYWRSSLYLKDRLSESQKKSLEMLQSSFQKGQLESAYLADIAPAIDGASIMFINVDSYHDVTKREMRTEFVPKTDGSGQSEFRDIWADYQDQSMYARVEIWQSGEQKKMIGIDYSYKVSGRSGQSVEGGCLGAIAGAITQLVVGKSLRAMGLRPSPGTAEDVVVIFSRAITDHIPRPRR